MARAESNGSNGFERNGGSQNLDGLIDDWFDLLGRQFAAAEGASGRRGLRIPRSPVPLRDEVMHTGARRAPEAEGASLVVAFDDSESGTVILLRVNGQIVHRGLVAPRGPAAPPMAARLALGLSEWQSCAIDFVADWFGAPFDAVNVARSGPERLTWGIWNFSGERLARCLARWKERAPESFAALLSSAGVDVESPAPGTTDGVPVLSLAGGRGARTQRTLTSDPHHVAVFARAGRHLDGQLAQIDSIVHDILEPAGAAELVQTVRGLAVVLYLELRLGAAARQITRSVAANRSQPNDESAYLDGLVERLRAIGRAVDAHNVLRILATPELGRA